MSTEEVFRVARENFETVKSTWAPYRDVAEGVFFVDTGDAYESSRLLFPGLLDGVPTGIARPVFALPHSAMLLVADGGRDAAVQQLAEIAQREFSASPHPLSPALYTVDERRTVFPYYAEGNGRGAHAIRRGHQLLAMSDYNEQTALLDRQFQEEGVDIYVAKLSLATSPNGRSYTFTTWAPADTLLPRADYVGIALLEPIDGRKFLLVSWDEAQRIAGTTWEPSDEYEPPRWRLRAGPSDALLAELRCHAVEPNKI